MKRRQDRPRLNRKHLQTHVNPCSETLKGLNNANKITNEIKIKNINSKRMEYRRHIVEQKNQKGGEERIGYYIRDTFLSQSKTCIPARRYKKTINTIIPGKA